MRYLNEKCPVCNKPFGENDEIAVCPVCGTPHHRECYKKSNSCANESLHEQGFDWKPSEAENYFEKKENEAVRDGHNIVFCPKCGKENPAEEPNCLYCSERLYNNGPLSQPVNLPNMSNARFGTNVIEISPDDTIGENKVSDIAEYIQLNANKYIPKMYKAEKTGKKLTFNWAAFILAPYWFFFRKMNITGFVLVVVLLFSACIGTTPRIIDMTQRYEQATEAYTKGEMSADELAEISKEMLKTPEVLVITVCEIAVRLFSGFFANTLYKKKIEKDIKEIKENSLSKEEYRLRIFKKGGVSGLMLGLSILGYYCAEQILTILITKGN